MPSDTERPKPVQRRILANLSKMDDGKFHKVANVIGDTMNFKNDPIEIFPDFPTGGIVDVSEYDDGRGKVKVRARVEKRDDRPS